MNRPIEQDDICTWPCGTYCRAEDLEEMLMSHSDDYEVLAYDSIEAALITGALEDGCLALFSHEHWQVLSDKHMAELRAFLGIR